MKDFPCSCCGFLTLPPPGSNEICRICGWEDDVSQLRFPRLAGGANRLSLLDAQRHFGHSGISDPSRTDLQPPGPFDRRDPTWRPVDDAVDAIEDPVPGVDAGASYPSDRTTLYYWRPTFWRRPPAI